MLGGQEFRTQRNRSCRMQVQAAIMGLGPGQGQRMLRYFLGRDTLPQWVGAGRGAPSSDDFPIRQQRGAGEGKGKATVSIAPSPLEQLQ